MRLRIAALAAALALGACKGESPSLQSGIDRLAAQIDTALGAKTLPGKFVAEIYAVHADDRSWRFAPDADNALLRTCEAVRGLATADYESWRDTASVVRLLAALSADHPSALVRVDAIASLATMSSWTSAAVPATDRRADDGDVISAIQQITEAPRRAAGDPEVAPALADALNTLSAYRFDEAKTLGRDASRSLLQRGSSTQLVMASKVLGALTGGALDGFDADPRVREALDRALVSTSASAIRLAIISAAVGGPTDVVRSEAVRAIARSQPDQAARILGIVMRGDDVSAVRRDAARSLAAFPAADSVPELLDGLADDRMEVRATAAASLASVTGQSFGDDRGAWVRWWQSQGGATAPSK